MRSYLAEALKVERKKNKTQIQVNLSKDGPGGDFDVWLMREGVDDCWVQMESVPSSTARKQIIISNAFLAEQHPISNEIEMLTALIADYDVYIWQGKNEPTLITSISDFWEKRKNIYPASAEEVEDELAQKGISAADKYIVLDQTAYRKLLDGRNFGNQKRHEKYGGLHLDFKNINILENREKMFRMLVASNAKSISIENPSEEELILILEAIPQLEHIEVSKVSLDWLDEHLSLFNGKQVDIVNIQTRQDDYELHSFNELKSLSISVKGIHDKLIIHSEGKRDEIEYLELDDVSAGEMTAARNTSIKEMVIRLDENSKLKILNLEHLERLEKLTINSNNARVKFQKITLPISLKQINIHNKMQNIDLSYLPLLEEVIIESETYPLLNPKNIKKLHLYSFSHLNPEKHPEFPVLEELELKFVSEADDWKRLRCPNLKKLKALSCNTSDIDLRDYGKLEELEISCSRDLKSIKLPNTIKKLKLTNLESLQELDLSKLVDLEELVITSLGDFSKLKLPPNIKAIALLGVLNGKMDFTNLSKLENLQVHGVSLQSGGVEIGELPPSLKQIKIDYGQLKTTRSLNSFPNLEKIEIQDSTLDKNTKNSVEPVFNLNRSSLHTLNIERSPLPPTIDFTVMPEIVSANLISKTIKKVDASSPNLENLHVWMSQDSEKLDISNAENLKKLEIVTSMASIINELPGNTTLESLIAKPIKYSYLSLSGKLDLSKFPSLDYLELGTCELINVTIESPSLTNLFLSGVVQLDNLDLTHLNRLEKLTISGYVRPEPLNCLNNPNIKKLHLTKLDMLSELDLSKLTDLEELQIDTADQLKLIKLPPNCRLKRITINDVKNFDSNSIDFSACQELEYIAIQDSPIKIVDFANLKKLKSISISNDKGEVDTAINCTNCHSLVSAEVISSGELSIDLTGTHKLRTLTLHSPRIAEINNIKQCTNLKSVAIVAGNAPAISKILSVSVPPACIVQAENHPSLSDEQIPNLSEEQEILSMMNNQTSVSVLDFDESFSVDEKTGKPDNLNAKGGFKITVFNSRGDIRDKFRIQILDRIEFKDGKITFNQAEPQLTSAFEVKPNKGKINEALLKKLKEKAMQDDTRAVGIMEGTFAKNKVYPLAAPGTFQKGQLEFYSDPEDAVRIFWDDHYQQYFAMLKKDVNSKPVKLVYDFKYNHDYEFLPQNHQNLYQSNRPLLPPDISNRIYESLKDEDEFAFLFDKSLKTEQKLELLIKCMRNKFETGGLKSQVKNDLDILLAEAKEKKGACRHVSNAFMLLCHFLQVPVHRNRNERHTFCEIPYQENGKLVWHKIDLGGANALDLTPLKLRENAFDKIVTPAPAKKEVSRPKESKREVTQEKTKPSVSPMELTYKRAIDKMVEEEKVTSIDALLAVKEGGTPLIVLSPSQNPWEVSRQLNQQYKDKKHFLYIDRPEDFAMYLHPRMLIEGRDIKIDGPLMRMINEGGVVVVNWSNFTPTQIVSYKSILDTHPTLLGEKLSDKIKFIGLADIKTESCNAFNTRVKRFTWDDSLFKQEKLADEVGDEVKDSKKEPAEEIDLFHSPTWRARLYGRDEVKNKKLTLGEGKLIKAIKNNQPVIIYNPPKDEKFKLLMHRINHERRIFYNGEFLDVPPGFKIQVAHRPNPIELKNVSIGTSLEGRRPIYLGLHNLHECFGKMTVQNGERMPTHGLLQSFIPGKDTPNFTPGVHVFYVTESLPRSEWEQIIAFINDKENKLQDIKFEFVLAPGVVIDGVAKNKTPIQTNEETGIEVSLKNTVYTTNDPDLLSNQIASQFQDKTIPPLIIDVTPKMTFKDLIYEIKRAQDPKTDDVTFNFDTKDALKALLDGRAVILNGKLSPSLYQQILPILNGEKEIECNGHMFKIKGRLFAVMPKSVRDEYPILQSTNKKYSFEHYFEMFTKKDPFNEFHLNKLKTFYDRIAKLPHRGLGRPTPPKMTYHRMERMLNALKQKSPLHDQNPLKGLLNYDYPRYSEDYAYLNVIAKYTFAKFEKNGLRKYKLKKLYERFNLNSFENFKNHIWSVLNCCNSALLHSLLGDDLDKVINPNSSFPQLNEDVLKQLHQYAKAVVDGDKKAMENILEIQQNAAHEAKALLRLNTLLKDENTPLIILKGEPGVGKTYAVRKLIGKYYEGEQGILECLADKTDKPKYLLLDEGNTFDEGTWDMFKGIIRGDKTVYYKGKEYSTKNIKLISTINHEDHPNRKYHQFFQNYGETIYMAKPSDDYLKSEILTKLLKPHGLADQETLNKLVLAYNLIGEHNPYFHASIRDIQNLAERFITLTSLPKTNKDQALLKACIIEFAGSIKNLEARQRFISDLETKLKIKSLKKENQKPYFEVIPGYGYALPNEKAYLVEAIEQNIMMRQRYLDRLKAAKTKVEKEAVTMSYKPAILIEGPSGVGKSTLYQIILEKKRLEMVMQELGGVKYAKDSVEYQAAYQNACARWKYEVLAVGSKEVRQKAKDAFHAGTFVILDELNLGDEELLKELTQYATGFDMDGNPPNNPGCMFFISQNYSSDLGRKSVAPALRNRMHFMYMDAFTENELEAVAGYTLPQGKEFVSAFRQAEKEHEGLNTRTFFYAIKYVSTHVHGLFAEKNAPVNDEVMGKSKPADSVGNGNAEIYIQDFRLRAQNSSGNPSSFITFIEKESANKEKLLDAILGLKDTQQKIDLLGQALDPQTDLGKVFWKKRGGMLGLEPSLNRGTLEKIKLAHNKLMTKDKKLISPEKK